MSHIVLSQKKINRKNWNNNHNFTKSKNIKNKITVPLTPREVSGIKAKSEYHSKGEVNVREIAFNETDEICSLCGEKILNIVDVFSQGGKYVHFSCALDEIKKNERVGEDETISYIGSGNFGLYKKDPSNHYILLKKIPFESKEECENYRKYLDSIRI